MRQKNRFIKLGLCEPIMENGRMGVKDTEYDQVVLGLMV